MPVRKLKFRVDLQTIAIHSIADGQQTSVTVCNQVYLKKYGRPCVLTLQQNLRKKQRGSGEGFFFFGSPGFDFSEKRKLAPVPLFFFLFAIRIYSCFYEVVHRNVNRWCVREDTMGLD